MSERRTPTPDQLRRAAYWARRYAVAGCPGAEFDDLRNVALACLLDNRSPFRAIASQLQVYGPRTRSGHPRAHTHADSLDEAIPGTRALTLHDVLSAPDADAFADAEPHLRAPLARAIARLAPAQRAAVLAWAEGDGAQAALARERGVTDNSISISARQGLTNLRRRLNPPMPCAA